MWHLLVNVIQAFDTSAQGTTQRNISISNLTCVAFFFPLWNGKYYKGSIDTTHHPFRLRGVQLSIGQNPYNAATSTNNILTQEGFVSLLFATHNNGVKGESIGHRRTVQPQGYPVAVMRHQVAYLRRNGATGATPISSIKKGNKR